MKKILFLLCAGAAWIVSAAVQIGDAAPELPAEAWYSGKPLSLKNCQGKTVVLFFWKVENGEVRQIPAIIKVAQKMQQQQCAVAIVANGMLSILRGMPMNQYIPVPQLADEKGKLLKAYLPEGFATPAAVIIGKKGELIWRGPLKKANAALSRFQSGKWDRETVKRQDRFWTEFGVLQRKSDTKKSLALIENELKCNPPNPAEFVALQVAIFLKQRNSLDDALKCVQEAQKSFPKTTVLYEMELKLLEQNPKADKTSEFYAKVIRLFPDKVELLLKFLQYEMSLNCTKMRPGNAYMLARAAWHAPKFRDKKEQGKAAMFYAQTLYCCGRVDLALKMAEKAQILLKGTPQGKGAEGLAEFYRRIRKLAPVIKE